MKICNILAPMGQAVTRKFGKRVFGGCVGSSPSRVKNQGGVMRLTCFSRYYGHFENWRKRLFKIGSKPGRGSI